MQVTERAANDTNLVASALSIAILLLRSFVTRKADHVTLLSKYICVVSIAVVAARIPVAFYLLQYSSKATALQASKADSAAPVQTMKIAACLALTARCLATTYFWLQITLLLRFYTRLVSHIKWAHRAISVTWVAIILTYLACILATVLECEPIHLYWASNPKPRCARAYLQVFMQGGFNIILDIMLLVIAFPIAARRNLNGMQLVQVGILMTIGTFCIVVTGMKLAFVVGTNSNQSARTFWASLQVLVSTFVANAPTIYGCMKLKQQAISTQRQSYYPQKAQGMRKIESEGDTSELGLRYIEMARFKSTRPQEIPEERVDASSLRGESPFFQLVQRSPHPDMWNRQQNTRMPSWI
jgi:hypothetical protein